MGKSLWLAALAAAAPIAGRAQSAADLTNLREDINGLTQRMGELTLRVEQLENAASAAPRPASKPPSDMVTASQLQAAVADLTAQMERLRASIPAPAAPAPAPKPSAAAVAESTSHAKPAAFSDDFSKQGVVYEVQKGDTLALIAKKTGGKFQDIVNANKIAEPSKIRVGQKLFIPGGK